MLPLVRVCTSIGSFLSILSVLITVIWYNNGSLCSGDLLYIYLVRGASMPSQKGTGTIHTFIIICLMYLAVVMLFVRSSWLMSWGIKLFSGFIWEKHVQFFRNIYAFYGPHCTQLQRKKVCWVDINIVKAKSCEIRQKFFKPELANVEFIWYRALISINIFYWINGLDALFF